MLIKENGFPAEKEFEATLLELYALPEREYQYFAIEVLVKYRKQWPPDLWKLLEQMITQKSWWDTVDYIATGVAGPFFKLHPELVKPVTHRWMASGNIWLQRVCLLFQLLYKKETDTKLLFGFIEKLKDSNEFFIQKAIGWALRQYARTDAETVRKFVETTDLKPLSRREALKHISKER